MRSFSDEINELNIRNIYPFHMPGHKRRMELKNPYDIDITEIDGYDNLHNPEGIINELEDRISGLYDEKRKFIYKSYILVNGSTCGILSAISAVTAYGDRILMARNSHKSAYNAACIRGLDVSYIYPEYIEKLGMNSVIAPEELADKLCSGKNASIIDENNYTDRIKVPNVHDYTKKNNPYKAVYITSPTYEGIVSDISRLSKTVHDMEIPFIVDEAHGAHFGLAAGFPDTAIKNGADIVIQSIHKTLMGMTQTAVLHVSNEAVSSKRVDIGKLEYYLRVYQSSSPSYVLMASVDECVRFLENKERKGVLFNKYLDRLKLIHNTSKKWKDIHIFLPEAQDSVDRDKIFDHDCGKLVIYSEGGCMSGRKIYDILRDKYGLQLEMALGRYCLAMTSCMDSDEGVGRLIAALDEIDKDICKGCTFDNEEQSLAMQEMNYACEASKDDKSSYIESPQDNENANVEALQYNENTDIEAPQDGENADIEAPQDNENADILTSQNEANADIQSSQNGERTYIAGSKNREEASYYCAADKEHGKKSGYALWTQGQKRVEKKYTISQAFEMRKVLKRISDGDIAGDYGYVYPPGIPFIVPGEIVTKEIICDIINAKLSGYEVHGVEFKDAVPYMNCVV